MRHFDCIVIGTGPAGQKAAIQAAKLGKSVAIIENNKLGGASINTGTIPSKALREAVLHLTGAGKRGLFGESLRMKRNITVSDLIYVSQQVIHQETTLIRDHFNRNDIELIWGTAHFVDANTLTVEREGGADILSAENFIIATGTRPATPANVPFNDKTIFTSDGLLRLDTLPRTMIVVGGGVVGVEYACILATLGVKITLVEGRSEILGFLDHEITEALQYQMRRAGITLRLGEKVANIEEISPDHPELRKEATVPTATAAAAAANDPRQPDVTMGGNCDAQACSGPANGNSHAALVQATLESGKHLHAQALLYAVGRQGTTVALGLDQVGLTADDRQRLKVNENYQTEVPHIYAAGDVIGFPALASTAMEQGRLAACHAFGVPTNSMPELFPFGIYAIPEISMVGKTEEQLTKAGIPYEAGIAQYSELARGQLLGDHDGMLKLLIHQDDHTILGVHAIGTGVTELIHIGQAVMAFKGTVDYFINNVFNYPTLAEAYKVAALNGLNKLRHV